MAKKVTAPKTHKPSGNRPLEHLAYLNRREMDYLRALNGGYMERGPRGLPSFAEETVGPGGGNLGGGGKGPSSSAGTSTSGSSSRSGTTASSSAASTPKSQTFSRSDVMMTDANGVQYDYNGNAIKSAATPQKSSSTASQSGFSSFRYGSGENIDKKIQSAAQVSGTVKAAVNSPAVKSDLASGGIKSLNVGPMGTRVSVGSISKTATTPSGFSGPSSFSAPPARISSSPAPSAKIGMSAPRGFYDGITTEQESALRGLQQQAERQSLGLVGKSASDPRSTISTPANRPMSAEQRMGFTEALKRAGVTAFNAMSHPMQTAGSLVAGAATSAANDVKNTMQSIYAATDPRVNMMPGVKEAAVENAFNTALNYGVTGLGVSGTTGAVPKNSIGAFVSPKVSPIKGMQDATQLAKDLWSKYGPSVRTPEEFFELNRQIEQVTRSYVPSTSTGVQRFGNRLGVEITESWEPKVPEVRTGMTANDVYKLGDIKDIVPQVKGINMIGDPNLIKNEKTYGYFNEGDVEIPNPKYSGIVGGLREYGDLLKGFVTGQQPNSVVTVKGPVTAISTLNERKLGMSPQELAGHEIGGHGMARLSEKYGKDFSKDESLPSFGTENFYGAISNGSPMKGAPVGPDAYFVHIVANNPNISREDAWEISKKIYNAHIEENAANLIGSRVKMTEAQRRNDLISERLAQMVRAGRHSDWLRKTYGSHY